ncbi:sugar kinase [candidate division KSB1 bacterium 4572_119]|nr:MAG: sugar kinase [candidate division KSB1 bacterium 4572_119]
MSVLVVGSVALDSVETPHGKVDDALGGSATFFSAAASHFTDVSVVAVVGDDFPFQEIEFLKKRSVNFDGLVQKPGKTFRWGGKYLSDMNQRETLFTHLNVFEEFDPELPEKYKSIPYIFLANIHPQLQLKVLNQIQNPKLVVLDTMNFWIEGTPDALIEVLKKVNILIINDSEVRLLSGENNIFSGAKKILEMGPNILVVKKGEHGALLISNGSYFWAPAFPLEKLQDPTGAGDTFAGGFVGYLAKSGYVCDKNLRRAVIYGSTLASFCVEKFSLDRLKEINKNEIDERYQQFINMTKVE